MDKEFPDTSGMVGADWWLQSFPKMTDSSMAVHAVKHTMMLPCGNVASKGFNAWAFSHTLRGLQKEAVLRNEGALTENSGAEQHIERQPSRAACALSLAFMALSDKWADERRANSY